jgi:hypothetical protein
MTEERITPSSFSSIFEAKLALSSPLPRGNTDASPLHPLLPPNYQIKNPSLGVLSFAFSNPFRNAILPLSLTLPKKTDYGIPGFQGLSCKSSRVLYNSDWTNE